MMQDALSEILNVLKMRSSVYFRTAFSSPWGLSVPAYSNVARFHMAMRGECWLRVAGQNAPTRLVTGDLAVVPHGRSHILSDTPEREATALDNALALTDYDGTGAFSFGGPEMGEACQLFCGHFELEEGTVHPIFSALPAIIHIPNTDTMNALWLEPITRFVTSESLNGKPGSSAIVHRLTEIIFIQIVRAFVERSGDEAGYLAGLLDRQLSKSLFAVHRSPEKPWTVESMAVLAGMSRTVFASRFSQLIGMTPLAYVTDWRMLIARRRLLDSDQPIIVIAESVGYKSESAFARAFKRQFGITPGSLR